MEYQVHQECCFACDKPLKPGKYLKVVTEDDAQVVFVGPDCFKRIKAAGDSGYQPTLGGPKLYADPERVAEAMVTLRQGVYGEP